MALLKQNFVKYGLLMSAATALCILYVHATGGYSNQQNIGKSPVEFVFIVFVPLIIWYLGISARKKQLKGKMSYKEGLIEGVKISLAYGVSSPFVYLIYYTFINPEVLSFMRKEYGLKNVSDTVVIIFDMLVQFFAAVVFGTIYGAIVSIFLRSKKKLK